MSVREQQEKLVACMKKWQKLEDAAVAQTARIMEEIDHPLIRLVAEIIQRDSNMHHRIQQMVVDTLTHETVTMSFDDMKDAWHAIEKHIELEKMTIDMAKTALELVPEKTNQIQRYLLSYLAADEAKHDKMLADLELLKKGVYS